MKLLTRHYKLYLYIALPLFVIVAIGYYFFLLRIITNKADESLKEDKAYIVSQLYNTDKILDQYLLDMSDDYILKKAKDETIIKDQFSTLMIYDPTEDEEEPYRQLFCTISVQDKHYELTLRKSMVEYNAIMYSILLLGTVFSIMLAAGFTILNRVLTKSLWSPFYKTIDLLSSYTPEVKQRLHLPKSQIEEFELLNTTVAKMSEKIHNDFGKQKKFIDHVSHEVQTPLSVINANIENILQSKNLTTEDFQFLENISESSTKLSKVIRSLLLLSRLENDQFEGSEQVEFYGLFKKHFDKNHDYLENKSIQLNFESKGSFWHQMNPMLADILVSNLVQNAIRHSTHNGRIWLTLIVDSDKSVLELSNMGKSTFTDPKSMFEIFKKGSNQPESTGIGLSIVKEICNKYSLDITYEVEGLMHKFRLEK